jgi:bile acid:Na+ symporter, BASS family
MTIDQIINLVVTLTLIQMMVAIGLGVKFADLVGVARNWRLVTRAGLANYVCVPAIVVGLLLLFQAHPMVAAGFLIAAVCPGAPYGPPFTGMARGNVTVAVGLMVILAASSAVVAPLLLLFLLPLMAGDEPLKVDAVKMVGTLLLTQLLPLAVGLAVRHRRPKLADKLKKPAHLLSTVLNVVVIGCILVIQFQKLAEIRPVGFVGMLVLLLATLGVGWLLGGPGGDNRKAMALSTAVRNVSVSLVIATASFPGTQAVTAALAYALIQTVALALLALAWGRLSSAKEVAVTVTQP